MRPEFDIRPSLPALSAAAVCAVAAMALAQAMGIGRFAFTPLLPLMVRDGALAPSAAPWIAASNYLGYLAGALMVSRLNLSLPTLMRASLAGIALATAAPGMFEGSAALLASRFAAGVLSAWAMVATSAWTLQHLARMGRTDLSGRAYAGVGLGIAVTGLVCLAAGGPGLPAGKTWLGLGALGAVALAVALVAPLGSAAVAVPSASAPAARTQAARASSNGLVICYGILGFGYILPATFLPAMAHQVVNDPLVFGLAWPIFGIAAALSTVAAARFLGGANRLRVWAASHLLMAAGVVLPSIWPTPAAIGIAALLVGSTFMVVTMLGMQEARARAPDNPTALLGRMTAAFAFGQLAGPVASGVIDLLDVSHGAALAHALQLAAVTLAASAGWLLFHSSRRHA